MPDRDTGSGERATDHNDAEPVDSDAANALGATASARSSTRADFAKRSRRRRSASGTNDADDTTDNISGAAYDHAADYSGTRSIANRSRSPCRKESPLHG